MTFKLVIGAGCCAFCAGLSWGAETAPAGAVVGWWRFNESPYKADSSGNGNAIDSFASGVGGVSSGTASGCYDGSGYLDITTAGRKATTVALSRTWDTSKGYTYAMKFKSNCSAGTYDDDPNISKLLTDINDKTAWHFVAFRYDPDKLTGSGKSTNWLFTDPNYNDSNGAVGTQGEISGTYTMYFPLGLSGDKATIGGTIGAKIIAIIADKSVDYKGTMDDVIVINRTLAKCEISRLYKTGEAYVYLKSSAAAFASASGWSSAENNQKPTPADLPGADYIVDSGRTLTANASGTFGGHSLTLGRTEPLTSVLDGSTVATTKGNFTQTDSVTIGDLRLNDGKLTVSAGATLTATKLTVNATAANPYEVNVASGTYAVSGTAAGTGSLLKTGAGTLDLTGLTGAAKVVVTEGKVLAGPNVTVTYDLAEDKGDVPVLMVE